MSKERNGNYRSFSRSKSRSRTRSRTRSRSNSRRRYSRSPRRHHSPSPYSRRRGGGGGGGSYGGNRDAYGNGGIFDAQRLNPPPSPILGVFGLSTHTTERDLKDVFGKYGKVNQIRLIVDKRTNKSRGFGFVYFDRVDDAKEAKRKCHGSEVDGKSIRVDYSIGERDYSQAPPSRPPPPYRRYRESPYGHSPPTSSSYRGGGGGGGRNNERSSPNYKRYSRSRSRSYDRYRRSSSYKR